MLIIILLAIAAAGFIKIAISKTSLENSLSISKITNLLKLVLKAIKIFILDLIVNYTFNDLILLSGVIIYIELI